MNDKLTLDKLSAVEKMLTALLKSNDIIHWVGGYVQGRTTPKDDQRIGDPFIILYPASERLNHKICRVYEHDFAKLPDFVDTDVPEDARVDDNPDRDKAIKKRVYRPCPPFLITIYEGKETQMGPEKRFLDVVRVSRPKDETPQPTSPAPQPPAPAPAPAPLRAHVQAALHDYFRQLEGQMPTGLYDLVLQEVERPLLETVMHFTHGNQTRAAEVLGINRSTLRKKLRQYGLE